MPGRPSRDPSPDASVADRAGAVRCRLRRLRLRSPHRRRPARGRPYGAGRRTCRRTSAGRRSRARCRPRRLGWPAAILRGPSSTASALPAFAGMEDALAARNAVGVIHHPTALETGLSKADRAATARHREAPAAAARAGHRHQRHDRRAARRGFRRRARDASGSWSPAPTMRRAASAPAGRTCNIISVGTLVPRKGHDVLLRALARLFDLDWHLTIVGSPERDPVHARTLAALAEELGIASRVRLRRRSDRRGAGSAVARGRHVRAGHALGRLRHGGRGSAEARPAGRRQRRRRGRAIW